MGSWNGSTEARSTGLRITLNVGRWIVDLRPRSYKVKGYLTSNLDHARWNERHGLDQAGKSHGDTPWSARPSSSELVNSHGGAQFNKMFREKWCSNSRQPYSVVFVGSRVSLVDSGGDFPSLSSWDSAQRFLSFFGFQKRWMVVAACDIVAQGLIGLIEYSYHQGIPSFSEA
jgi:hypothetical protein